MTIFQTLDIEFRLTTLLVEEHSDRFGTGAEPYIIPLFFKVDGERYSAIMSIGNTPAPPAEPTADVPFFDFRLDSDPPNAPLILTPAGPFLSDQTVEAGDDAIDIPNARVTTTLEPIPLVIDVAGLFDLRDILEFLVGPVVEFGLEGEPVTLLNLTLEGISGILAAALGLDENLESCPGPVDFDTEGFINQIEADFNTLIPGTIGGVFVGMENDDFDEDDIATVQTTIRGELRRVLIDLTDTVSPSNPIPDPESISVDQDDLLTRILLDLFVRLDPVFWFVAIVGLLWASADEFVGFHPQTFNHLDIESGNTDFDALLTREGEPNRWIISGTVEVQ